MPLFLIESRHTRSECLRAMHELLAQGCDGLERFYWGCFSGEHTAWATVDAENEPAARGYVPRFLRNRARVIRVGSVTPEQVLALQHK